MAAKTIRTVLSEKDNPSIKTLAAVLTTASRLMAVAQGRPAQFKPLFRLVSILNTVNFHARTPIVTCSFTPEMGLGVSESWKQIEIFCAI